MTVLGRSPDAIAALFVEACWVAFGLIVVLGKKGSAGTTKTRDFKSHLGFLVQGLSYGTCLFWSRDDFAPLAPMSRGADAIVAVMAVVLAVVSTWFCFAAARALGRQWALVARVIEGHQLIRRGPYAVVRNPIYLAMLGVLIATGLVFSRWQAIPAALVVFLIGTEIRIRSEERLLRENFGAEFEAYAHEVPALIPKVH
jgi:hypothetical protein